MENIISNRKCKECIWYDAACLCTEPERNRINKENPDESINIIDFVHGYDYCINAMKKEIHKLFEDTINGTAGEFTRGWNLALRELLKAMEKPF